MRKKSITAEAQSETETHLSVNETESGSGCKEPDELEDLESPANDIFDESGRPNRWRYIW